MEGILNFTMAELSPKETSNLINGKVISFRMGINFLKDIIEMEDINITIVITTIAIRIID